MASFRLGRAEPGLGGGLDTAYRAMEADPDGAGQLLDVGFSLLRETPFDQVAWGFVLPELCRSPHRADAMDMGQRWVEGAPPKSACWGYVFPAVWRNGERPYRLRSIAHAWLTQTPHSHPSWWFVWEALAKTSRYDRQLLAMGIDYLDDMPAEDQGWARVWEVLWTLEFERAQLEPRARGWLATTGAPIDELGWPRVFSRLFTETALDETMLSRASVLSATMASPVAESLARLVERTFASAGARQRKRDADARDAGARLVARPLGARRRLWSRVGATLGPWAR